MSKGEYTYPRQGFPNPISLTESARHKVSTPGTVYPLLARRTSLAHYGQQEQKLPFWWCIYLRAAIFVNRLRFIVVSQARMTVVQVWAEKHQIIVRGKKERTFLSSFSALLPKHTCFLCRIAPDDLNIQEQHKILQRYQLEQPEARKACCVMSDHDDER